MSKTPFLPLWVADFLAKTTDLDARETGAYMLILMALWTHGGSLPDDHRKLQRVARCGRDWPKVWGAIEHYFERDDGKIAQPRLTEELQKVAAKREVNSNNGARGGRAKAMKNKKPGLANATNSLKQPEPECTVEANASTDGGAVESQDFAKQLFDRGVAFLGRHGTPERQARSVIGKWRKAYTDTDIFGAFTECSRQGAVDPIPWITAALSGKTKGKANDRTARGKSKLAAFVGGATGTPGMDWREDRHASRPLLAGGRS